MKRFLSATLAVGLVAAIAGTALAWGPGRGMGMMGGPGMMGMGGPMMGMGRMGGGPGAGPEACPAWGGEAAATAPEAVTEDKARALATEYADKYLKGYTVEKVTPFTGRFRTAYEVELKGPNGETRVLHVNPWGGVHPFPGPRVRG